MVCSLIGLQVVFLLQVAVGVASEGVEDLVVDEGVGVTEGDEVCKRIN